jgi:hypothetical protein
MGIKCDSHFFYFLEVNPNTPNENHTFHFLIVTCSKYQIINTTFDTFSSYSIYVEKITFWL